MQRETIYPYIFQQQVSNIPEISQQIKMITLTLQYNVLPDRLITIKLPEKVSTGCHNLVVVLDELPTVEQHQTTETQNLMHFAGTVAAFKEYDGVAYQREVRSEWN